MTSSSKTLAALTPGILAIALVQPDNASDPVTVDVFFTDGAGTERHLGQLTPPSPSRLHCPGMRAVGLAAVPGATTYRVEASNGLSSEPVAVSLKYGFMDNAEMTGALCPVAIETTTSAMSSTPKADKALTVQDAGLLLVELDATTAVHVQVFYRDGAGDELCAWQGDIAAPREGSPSSRPAVLVSAPGATYYRVKADNGESEQPVSVALKYGLMDGLSIVDGLATGPEASAGGGGGGGGGSTGGPALVGWLATNGDDVTAALGDQSKPFATLAAAIAAARDAGEPVTILAAPGTYVGQTLVDASDGPLQGFTLRAMGEVILQGGNSSTGALSVVSGGPAFNANLDRWVIEGVTFARTDNQNGIYVTGAANLVPNSTSLFQNGLTLRGCKFQGSSWFFSYLGKVLMEGCTTPAGAIAPTLSTCLDWEMRGGVCPLSPVVTFDGSAHRGTGRVGYRLSAAARLGGAALYGAPNWSDDETCVYTGVFGSGALACYYDGSRNIDLAPVFNVRGTFQGLHNIQLPAESVSSFAAARPSWSGDFAAFRGACNVFKTAGSYIAPVSARCALFTSTLSFTDNVAADIRGASYDNAQLNTSALGAATVDRDSIPLGEVTIESSAATGLNIVPPLPSAGYTACFAPMSGIPVHVTAMFADAVALQAESASCTGRLTLIRD